QREGAADVRQSPKVVGRAQKRKGVIGDGRERGESSQNAGEQEQSELWRRPLSAFGEAREQADDERAGNIDRHDAPGKGAVWHEARSTEDNEVAKRGAYEAAKSHEQYASHGMFFLRDRE